MIRQSEVDGVPVLLAPTTGPLHAGLAFRVGVADEPLPRRGITHLIEHLALHSAGVADYHYNGATGTRYTYFHMRGSETDVVKFLNGVCVSLRALPLDRLATEKEILRTEADGRSGLGDLMAMWRYGARGYGTAAFPEWALPGLTADDLNSWIARYFTAGNAALWIAGDTVPAGLRLDLPAGAPQPLPPVTSALPERPAFFPGPPGSVAWNAVVPRSPASYAFSRVLERAMMRSLRQESGLSYRVTTDYEPLGDDTAMVLAYADALPEKQSAALGGLVDVLAALRVGRADPADLAAVVNRAAETIEEAEQRAERLAGQALNLLTGHPVQPAGEALAGLRAVTMADVTEVAVAAWHDGLLMTPPGTRGDWAGFTPAPDTSPAATTGTEYAPRENSGARLVVGDEGVSLHADRLSTVRFAECEALLMSPDGARHLIGPDAMTVAIEPALWRDPAPALALIDARVPADRRIAMPPRNPADIPQPAAPPERAAMLRGIAAGLPWQQRIVLAALGLVALACTVLIAYELVAMVAGRQDPGGIRLVIAGSIGLGVSSRALRRRWDARLQG